MNGRGAFARAAALAWSIALLGSAGCTATEQPWSSCTPGTQIACACPRGGSGVQRCADDGSRFGECVECPAAVDAVAETEPDSTIGSDSDPAPEDSVVPMADSPVTDSAVATDVGGTDAASPETTTVDAADAYDAGAEAFSDVTSEPDTAVADSSSGASSDSSTDATTDVPLDGGVVTIAQLCLGNFHTCALTAAGRVWCWGVNWSGQLGDGTKTTRPTPVVVPGLTDVKELACGQSHTCALKNDGSVWCWGSNAEGEIGDGTMTDRTVPTAAVGVANVKHVTSSHQHTCVLTHGNAVQCWGMNRFGQIGDGTKDSPRRVAVPVTVGFVPIDVVASVVTTCARSSDKRLYCWGDNAYGQLGDGTKTESLSPKLVAGVTNVDQVAAGYTHTCARWGDRVSCWGYNSYGFLGDGTTVEHLTPMPVLDAIGGVAVTGVAEISGSFNHYCLRKLSGELQCWAWNVYGTLGDGTNFTRLNPVPVKELASVTGVWAGDWHTCAVASGVPYCWGSNGNYQLGDGTATNRWVPTRVAF